MFGESKIFLLAVGVSVFLLGVSAQSPPDTTTTAKPTTAPTTTQPPTTTTKPPTTPAVTTTTAKPAPTPKYPGNEGKYTLEDANNVTCIMMKGAIEVSVAYVDTEKKNRTANVDVPIHGVEVSGDCDKGLLMLKWNTSVDHGNSIKFLFEKNETAPKALENGEISSGKYALQDITGTLYKDPIVFVNISNPDKDFDFSLLNKAAFQTPLNHSYSCMVQEMLKSDDGSVTVKLSDIRMEAFRQTAAGNKNFSAAIDCPADDASDVVPIAVGAALAGLVVIVLIAYLIGRRRSRSRGYQSV